MKYDHFNAENLWKPGRLAQRCRDRLHRKLMSGLSVTRVFEVGPGLGEFADWCRRNGIGYRGMEPNDRLRDRLLAQGYEVMPGRAPSLPAELPDGVDAIFASHLIEHLAGTEEALQFVQNAHALLSRSGGRWLILLYPDIDRCREMFWQDYTHSFVTTRKRIDDLVVDCGFRVHRSGRYTACFFRASRLISALRHITPYFLLPRKIAWFARLSYQQHSFTIADRRPQASGP